MTIQALDRLVYDGKPWQLRTELSLRSHASLVMVSDREAREQWHLCFTTACWRNFDAEWEIRDRKLFLNAVRGKFNLRSAGPLLAEWISGTIVCEELEVVSDFWDENYNGGLGRELILELRAGVVTHESFAA